jgi:hypothetical protein
VLSSVPNAQTWLGLFTAALSQGSFRTQRGGLVVDENGRPVEGAGLEVLQRLLCL